MSAKMIPAEGEVFVGHVPAVRKLAHVTVGVASNSPDVTLTGEVGQVATLFDVNVPIVVTKFWTQVTDGFLTDTAAVAFGDSDDIDRFIDVVQATTVGIATGAVLVDATGLSVPYVYAAAQDIQAVTETASFANGLIHVYMEYYELND